MRNALSDADSELADVFMDL